MAEQYKTTTVSNAKGRSTLASGYTSGGSSLVLQAGEGARFPTTGNFRVGVGDPTASDYEIFQVTSRSTDTLTVTGAQENTPAGNHSSGAAVKMILTEAALDGIRADLASSGTLSARPTGKNGDRYYATDSIYGHYEKISGVWRPVWNGRLVTEPAIGDYTAVNSASAVDTNGGITLSVPSAGSYSMKMMKKAAPSTPYVLTAIVQVNYNSGNYQFAGICFFDGTKILSVSVNNYVIRYEVTYWSDVNTAAAGEFASIDYFMALAPPSGANWLRIANDGSTLSFYHSVDGINFNLMYSQAVATRLTPTHLGLFGVTNNSKALSANLLHWAES